MELDINSYIADKMMTIPFSPPDISDLEINEVVDTLRSGWITTGPKVKSWKVLSLISLV